MQGEIYENIRAIVYRRLEAERAFTLRYYLDREPTEDDYESAALVTTEFIAHFTADEILNIREECVYNMQPPFSHRYA